MKYELTSYSRKGKKWIDSRDISDKDFLDDIRRVSVELKKESLSKEEYDKYGKYSSHMVHNRFDSWIKALESSGLQIRKYPILTESDLLEDLKIVSEKLKKKSVTQNEYNSFGKYGSSTICHKCGSWFKALEKAGLEKTRNYKLTNEEYFENLEEIWTKLGRQPKYAEIQKPFSKYSVGAYEQRFGSWRKALEAFVRFMNEDEHENLSSVINTIPIVPSSEIKEIQHKTKRNINWRLGWMIKQRDNFTCKHCGRSPALIPGTILHVDHIKPYSKGGETVPENLQTLCMECNIGKGDLE